MNNYICKGEEVLEVACGIGLSKMFINTGNITISDLLNNSWVKRHEDALNLNYGDESLDVIIRNSLHQFGQPIKFFREARRVLKKGGRILFKKSNVALLCRNSSIC